MDNSSTTLLLGCSILTNLGNDYEFINKEYISIYMRQSHELKMDNIHTIVEIRDSSAFRMFSECYYCSGSRRCSLILSLTIHSNSWNRDGVSGVEVEKLT